MYDLPRRILFLIFISCLTSNQVTAIIIDQSDNAFSKEDCHHGPKDGVVANKIKLADDYNGYFYNAATDMCEPTQFPSFYDKHSKNAFFDLSDCLTIAKAICSPTGLTDAESEKIQEPFNYHEWYYKSGEESKDFFTGKSNFEEQWIAALKNEGKGLRLGQFVPEYIFDP